MQRAFEFRTKMVEKWLTTLTEVLADVSQMGLFPTGYFEMRAVIRSVFAASILLSAMQAKAATMINVDQDARVIRAPNEGTSAFGFGVFRAGQSPTAPIINSRLVQTFSAGSAGNLQRVEFQIFAGRTRNDNDQLRFTLFDGDYAAGSRLIVGSQNVSFAQIPDDNSVFIGQNLVSFDTSSFAYAIRPGQRYSVAFEALPSVEFARLSAFIGIFLGTEPRPGGGFQAITRGSGYTGGDAFFLSGNGTPILGGTPQDIGFRSFVSLSAVPEPGIWVMMIAGFAAIGVAGRRRATQLKAI